MEAEELRRRAGEISWFHTIDLGQGVVTAGIDDSPRSLERAGLPRDLTGKTVLDVGAWDGFYSFEAERRGASRVVAADSFAWRHTTPPRTGKAGFELAREALASRVEDVEIEVLDISPGTVGRFDVTMFLGVLYHLRHPLLALERLASVTDELLVLETAADLGLLRRPAMAFYPGLELAGDHTNWWGPNEAAVVAMLRDVGFPDVEVVHPTRGDALRGMAQRLGGAVRRGHRPLVAAGRGRLTLRARR